jgi:PTH1 family peptidyl-tRNA hydrolase
VGEREILLVLPQTFMNLSGESVRRLMNFYRLEQKTALLVVFDDLDLPFGHYKLTTALPRGHNGVLSVTKNLAGASFLGLRLGIDDRAGERLVPSEDYVLQPFPEQQKQVLWEQVFPAALEEVATWL